MACANSVLNTGVITTAASLDHEVQLSHIFTVEACDSGSPVLCAVTTVHINVADINDNEPTFDQAIYATDVCYSATFNGMDLVQPVATDGDSANAQLTFSLANSSPLFAIDSTSGRVSLAQTPSSTDIKTHTATIIAEDNGFPARSGLAQVTVRVLNCLEQDFYFTSPFHYFTIEEGAELFVGGNASLQIATSRAAHAVSIYQDPPTNPLDVSLSELLQYLQLKPFTDLLPSLRGEEDGLDREARSLYTIILEAQDDNQQTTFTSVSALWQQALGVKGGKMEEWRS